MFRWIGRSSALCVLLHCVSTPLLSQVTDTLDVRLAYNGRIINSSILARDVQIDTVAVTVVLGNTINAILRENNVIPDATSFALIAKLNPQLASLHRIETGQQLNIVRPKGLQAGYDIAFRLPATIRTQFATESMNIASNLPEWRANLAAGEHKVDVLGAASRLAETLEQLSTRLENVPPDLVATLAGRLGTFQSEMTALVQSGQPSDVEFLARVRRFENDIQLYDNCAKKYFVGCTVQFSVITKQGSLVHPNLTVWYTGEFTNDPQRLGISSPATGPITEADYYFWATNSSNHVVTAKVLKPVRRCHTVTDCILTLLVQ